MIDFYRCMSDVCPLLRQMELMERFVSFGRAIIPDRKREMICTHKRI